MNLVPLHNLGAERACTQVKGWPLHLSVEIAHMTSLYHVMLVVCATADCLYRGCLRITCLDVHEHHGGVCLLQLCLGPSAVLLFRCSGGKLRCDADKSTADGP